MNSKALRRLATDHSALHTEPLPPNYLFDPKAPGADDLTILDILLAGPQHTPFQAGVFKLHLTIPSDYPQQPPTAHFRTPIFHPNVDPQTGGVCVETLKRDWDVKLTLRDILVVIGCLLIQPNPDSALNAEAGSLIQDDYAAFARRAELMTGIHAVVSRELKEAVREAQNRGQEAEELEKVEEKTEVADFATNPATTVSARRRGPVTARRRGTTARRPDGSPSGASAGRRPQAEASQPFVLKSLHEDPFGEPSHRQPPRETARLDSDDDSMADADQENDELRSPQKPIRTPKAATPRRPPGRAQAPLGELEMEEASPSASSTDEEDMEAEYPPSPAKSPRKSPRKQPPLPPAAPARAESSRDALRRAPNITPPTNLFAQPLAASSPFSPANPSPSPRKTRLQRPVTPPKPKTPFGGGGGGGGGGGTNLFGRRTPRGEAGAGIFKSRPPSASEKKREEERKREALDGRLWELCAGDVRRWNQGDFDGEPFRKRAARW